MRILLADDHTLFRDALVQYIERAEPEASIMLAREMDEVRDILKSDSSFDLVLLDMRMPGMGALDGLKYVREMYPDLRVAVISGTADKSDVEQALALGAMGYFPKTLSGKCLISGMKQVIAGEPYIATDRESGELMPSHYGPTDGALDFMNGAGGLTPRERDVLVHLMNGESNKDIARALELQVVTVKLHIRGICRKLGAKNRTQAALIARGKSI